MTTTIASPSTVASEVAVIVALVEEVGTSDQWARAHDLAVKLGIATDPAPHAVAAPGVGELLLSRLAELAEVEPAPALTDCPDCAAYGPIGADHHDFVIACLEGGVGDLYALVAYADASSCNEVAEGEWTFPVGWSELPEFVARHNWSEPAAALDFANFVTASVARTGSRFEVPAV